MSDDHIIKLPLWVWILKIVQGVIAVLVLGFSAYGVHFIAFNSYCLALFTALFTLIILTYYFVSLHFAKAAYNWIAVLVLECLATIFWLSTMATLADTYSTGVQYYDDYNDGGYYDTYYWTKRDNLRRDPYTGVLAKRADTTTFDTYVDVFRAAIAFSVINWLLFTVTLIFLGLAVHKHRSAGKPMVAGGPTTDVEKSGGELQNVPATSTAAPAPTAPAAAAAPAPEHQYQQPAPYGQPQPGTYDQNSYVSHDQNSYISPASSYPPSQAPYQPPVSPPPHQVHEAA